MKRLILGLGLLLAAADAHAQQALLQGSAKTGGHAPAYQTSGTGQPVVIDSGPAGGNGTGQGLSELNITARGTGTAPYAGQGTGPNGEVACIQDAVSTNSTGYHYLCLSANAAGGGLLSYGAAGAASTLPFTFKVNNTSYAFPFVTGGIVGPGTTVVNDVACWNNTAGTLLKDCGAFPSVGGTANQIQYNAAGSFGGFTMSGDCTIVVATGVITCPKINGVTVSLGGALTTASTFTTAGVFPLTLTTTASTNVTLPLTGTLSTLAGAEAFTNKTYNGNTWTAGTGTLAIGVGKTFTSSNTLTLTATDGSTLAIGTGGTLGTAAYLSSGTSAGNVPVLSGSGFLLSSVIGAQTISANGYQSLGASGATLQWGTSGSAGGSGSVAVTFPLACSTAVYSVNITPNHVTSGAQAGDYVSAVSTSGFTINNLGANAGTYYWSAVCK